MLEHLASEITIGYEMLAALLVGLAQRACWIVLHSSCGQVVRRENYFSAELSSRRKQILAQLWPSTVCELERSIYALELDLVYVVVYSPQWRIYRVGHGPP
jgi:hypothetical protein